MKYLILNFKNARLFRKDKPSINKKTKDVSVNVGSKINGKTPRSKIAPFEEPITVHQVSNMIHVLFNERPVPSLRDVSYKRNGFYFNVAKNSFLRIDNPMIYNKSLGKDVYITEMIHLKKALPNAWNANVELNWKMVEEYIDDKDKFNLFTQTLTQILKFEVKNTPFIDIVDVIQSISKTDRLKIYDVIDSFNHCSGLKYVFGQYKNGTFTQPSPSTISSTANRLARTIVNGIDKCSSLRGQILVPIDDNMLNILKNNSKGHATLLDGGLVWIDSIKNDNEILSDGFTQMSEISDKRMNLDKN